MRCGQQESLTKSGVVVVGLCCMPCHEGVKSRVMQLCHPLSQTTTSVGRQKLAASLFCFFLQSRLTPVHTQMLNSSLYVADITQTMKVHPLHI